MRLPNQANNRSMLFHTQVHAGSTCTMTLKGSGPKEGILSRPRDPVEPRTPLEAPPHSSCPFVTPPPRYSLLCSMEHCTSSVYSIYVPLCPRLLFPSHPSMLLLAFVLIIVSLLVMTSLICHQCLILICSMILSHPPCPL